MRFLVLLFTLALTSAASAETLCRPANLPSVNSCAGPNRVSVAIVGDVLLHRPLAWRGYQRGFDTVWGAARPYLRAADITIANLEGPTAAGYLPSGRRTSDPGATFDDRVYTGYPQFNYHPSVIDALRDLGVDIVTTANNHSLDRGAAGLDATLSALDRRNMLHLGAVPSGQSRFAALRLNTPAGPLSLIACTFGVNGLPDPHAQVPRCYDDQSRLVDLIRTEAARGAGVVVLPHWGREYELSADRRQRRLAAAFASAGAMAVIGTHPHVPQPWDILEGGAHRSLVAYSTGNFVAAQPPLERATSLIAWLELCPGSTGAPVVGGAGFVPLQMEFEGSDPSLTMPHTLNTAHARAGIALLNRLIPNRNLSASLTCRSGRAPRPLVGR